MTANRRHLSLVPDLPPEEPIPVKPSRMSRTDSIVRAVQAAAEIDGRTWAAQVYQDPTDPDHPLLAPPHWVHVTTGCPRADGNTIEFRATWWAGIDLLHLSDHGDLHTRHEPTTSAWDILSAMPAAQPVTFDARHQVYANYGRMKTVPIRSKPLLDFAHTLFTLDTILSGK